MKETYFVVWENHLGVHVNDHEYNKEKAEEEIKWYKDMMPYSTITKVKLLTGTQLQLIKDYLEIHDNSPL